MTDADKLALIYRAAPYAQLLPDGGKVRAALIAAFNAGARSTAPTYTLLFVDWDGTAVTVQRSDGKECSFDVTRNPLASCEERKATALAIAARMAEEYWT